MNIYGYHRTSTKDQHLDRGIKEIEDYCKTNNLPLKKIFTDKQTGRNFNRPRYTVMKEDVLSPGDILIITEIDRLGRRKDDTLKELEYYKDNNIRVMVLEIPTTLMNFDNLDNELAKTMLNLVNKLMVEIYTTMAQAEMEKKEKRQREGISAKKERGEWEEYGRPKAMNFKQFAIEYQKVVNGEVRPFALMKKLGLTRSTFYRYKQQFEKEVLSKKEATITKEVVATDKINNADVITTTPDDSIKLIQREDGQRSFF